MNYRRLKSLHAVLLAILLTLPLIACGGSGGGGNSSSSTPSDTTKTVSLVSGVAATGAPMSGNVYLKDSDGTDLGPVTIDTDGSFKFDVTGLTPPFFLYAEDNAGNIYYSVAMGPGTANINPLTDLAVAAAAGVGDPAKVYDDPDGHPFTQDDLDSAIVEILNVLKDMIAKCGADGVNFLTNMFAANHKGMDKVLDKIEVDIDTVSGMVTFLGDKIDGDKKVPIGVTSVYGISAAGLSVSGNGMLVLGESPDIIVRTMSVDTDAGSLVYNDSFERIVDFKSTSITGVLKIVQGAVITGKGITDGGVTYSYTATVLDGANDGMGIVIYDPDNSIFHSAATMNIDNVNEGFTVVEPTI